VQQNSNGGVETRLRCVEGEIPMLHLYSAALLAVLAANVLIVLLGVVSALNRRERDH
jgi:hypothetical protein